MTAKLAISSGFTIVCLAVFITHHDTFAAVFNFFVSLGNAWVVRDICMHEAVR